MFVNHYYFYISDPDWGPAFIKTCAYAPFPVWLYLNGHAWAKRQAQRRGLAFEALDDGFRSCADAEALAAICDRLSAADVDAFLRRWQARLPSPFSPEDRRRGYGYALAFRELELSDTRVFDRPQAGGRGLSRPSAISSRSGAPITSRSCSGDGYPARPLVASTRVINRGVQPAIHVQYRASKVKQYFKEGRALRTETTVNDTRLRDRRLLRTRSISESRRPPSRPEKMTCP